MTEKSDSRVPLFALRFFSYFYLFLPLFSHFTSFFRFFLFFCKTNCFLLAITLSNVGFTLTSNPLILRSYLLRKLKDDQKTKHLTLEKVLLELRKIKVVTFEDLSRVLIPLTKIQKTILDVLGLSVNELQCSFS